MEKLFTLDNTLSTSPIEVIFFDADGVIQYSPEEWSSAFSRALAFDNIDQVQKFTADVFAAETAGLTRVDGFDAALDAVLLAWDRIEQKSFVIETMLCIEPYLEIQQMQTAQFMSTQLGYASMFDGEQYSCTLVAAKPAELYFELALKAIGANANSTLFIDDRSENVASARRVGIASFVYDGRSGASVLESELHPWLSR
jgi:beta-phosphoglucomutase-like phosphatase (HAD superfamily)